MQKAKPKPKPYPEPDLETDPRPITIAELHDHIQAAIFGRPSGRRGKRFDQLQRRLHDLVDLGDDLAVIEGFIERIKASAATKYLDSEGVSIFVASMELDAMRRERE